MLQSTYFRVQCSKSIVDIASCQYTSVEPDRLSFDAHVIHGCVRFCTLQVSYKCIDAAWSNHHYHVVTHVTECQKEGF